MFEFEQRVQSLLDRFGDDTQVGIEDGGVIRFKVEEKTDGGTMVVDRKFLVDDQLLKYLSELPINVEGFTINESARDVVVLYSNIGVIATSSRDVDEKLDLGGEERIEIFKTLDNKPYYSITRDIFGTYTRDKQSVPIRVTEHLKVKDKQLSDRIREIVIDA
jgi:hypothetical protein